MPRSRSTIFGRPDLLILLGLAAMTFAIYAQVIGHQFITLDDDAYIKQNAMVNRGLTLAGVAWAFTTFDQGNWHPLTWIFLVSVSNNTRPMAERAGRGAFCASSLARRVSRLGG